MEEIDLKMDTRAAERKHHHLDIEQRLYLQEREIRQHLRVDLQLPQKQVPQRTQEQERKDP